MSCTIHTATVHRSRIIPKLIVSMLRGETASEVVIPCRDPSAQVGDTRLIEPVLSKIFIGEYADTSEMVQDRFQIEVRVMTAGKSLKVGV